MRRLTELLRNLLGLDDASTTTLSHVENARQHVKWRIALGAALVLGAAAIVVAIVVSSIAALSSETSIPDNLLLKPSSVSPESTSERVDGTNQVIFVHVVGAVVNPGLYEVRGDARMVDAVMAAGGLTDIADPCVINLASAIQDGQQIVVATTVDGLPGSPSSCNSASGSGSGSQGAAGAPGSSSTGLISLSMASAAELDTLPGIGPALAQRIIDWRDASGGFTSVEQLGEVSGIGDKLLANIRDLVTP